MQDQVVGVAVLDRSEEPHTLLVLCQSASGLRRMHMLNAYPDGAQKPVMTAWKYKVDNGKLHVNPSLRVLGVKQGDPDEFHNSAQWDVEFQDWNPAEYGSHALQLLRANGVKEDHL